MLPTRSISDRMRAVRRRHTAVEKKLAAALRRRGFRFSTHKSLCGCTPDIIFNLERLVVFVDGDFWHGRILVEIGQRALVRSFRVPARKFWVAKIIRNVQRDARQVRVLRRNGWAVMRLWEKDVLRDVPSAIAAISRRLHIRRAKQRFQKGDS